MKYHRLPVCPGLRIGLRIGLTTPAPTGSGIWQAGRLSINTVTCAGHVFCSALTATPGGAPTATAWIPMSSTYPDHSTPVTSRTIGLDSAVIIAAQGCSAYALLIASRLTRRVPGSRGRRLRAIITWSPACSPWTTLAGTKSLRSVTTTALAAQAPPTCAGRADTVAHHGCVPIWRLSSPRLRLLHPHHRR